MLTPKISVIIPCYNQAQYLRDAVQSIILQTEGDWECIIVDDGSNDNTRDVALSLAARDSRIQYVHQLNRGLAGARNRGLDAARGRYIQFLDADDLIKENKFEFQLAAVTSGVELELIYCDYYGCSIDNPEIELPKRYVSPRLSPDNPLYDLASKWEVQLSIPVHCFLFDSRFFREYQCCFDESLPNHEDWDCWMRVLALNPRLVYVDQKLAIYRYRDNSMCNDLIRMRKGFLEAIKKQEQIWRHDADICEALKQKRRVTNSAYLSRISKARRKARSAKYQRLKAMLPENARRRLGSLIRSV
jgi:glycosyltransferase involved in cell wall biosynthesis